MGYLSQKKYKVREKIFFITAMVLMSLVTLALLVNSEFSILRLNLFHFYCISWIFFIGAIFARKIIATVVLGIILLVNYVLLAMSTNIFFSDTKKGDYQITIDYNKAMEQDEAMSKGILMIGQVSFAEYEIVNEEAPIMIVRVDLSLVRKNKYPLVLQSLRDFIMKQEVEIVVLGDFGVPAWSKVFREFVDASGLSVKNRLVFDGFFKLPTFYILGYNSVGVDSIINSNSGLTAVIDYSIL